jgi:phosphoglycolate phosphatase
MVSLILRGQPLMFADQLADIQAVLFDKDGTLSHSEPHLLSLAIRRLRHCVRLSGIHRCEELASLLSRAYGLHPELSSLNPAGTVAVAARDHNLISTAVAMTQVGHGWPESLVLAEETFRLADLETSSSPSVADVTEGLLELLRNLRRHHVLCAVISNDDTSGIHQFLQAHDLERAFAASWSADQQPRKPDPNAVHALCESLGVAPSRCALIGDANSDLHMALAAGVAVVIGYRGGWRQTVELEKRFLWLDHWHELLVAGDGEPAVGVSTKTSAKQTGT